MGDKSTVGTNFWTKIGNFVENVATLDVVTLTGDITLQIDGDGQQGGGGQAAGQPTNPDDTSWKEIITKAKAAAPQQVQPVAISHFEFDQDAVLYVKEDAVQNHKELLDLHNQTVATAQKVRSEFVQSLIGIFD
jgi:hypothetical protein